MRKHLPLNAGLVLPLLAAMSTVTVRADYAQAVLADSPVAYLRLGDSGPAAADSSGNGNNGQADGAGVIFGAPGLLVGDTNGALQLSGDRIIVPGFEKISSGFTVEFLVKIDQPSGQFANLVGDGEGGGDFDLMVYLTGGGAVRPHIQTDVGTYASDSLKVITDGRVHHIVSTWDKESGDHLLYIDGRPADVTGVAGFNPFGGEPLNTDNPLYIGRDGREQGFDGVIDEVAVYDYAISADRVAAHLAEAFGLAGKNYAEEVTADSPIAYWRLGDSAAPAMDASGNGRNAVSGAEGAVVFGANSLIPPNEDKAVEFQAGSLVSPPFEKINTGFTVEFVTRIDALKGGFSNLVGDGESGGDFNLMVYLTDSGKVRAHISTSAGVFAVDSVQSIVDGLLHHIASTWDKSTGQHALFIDGELAAVTPVAGTSPHLGDPANSDNPIFIGRDGRETGHSFFIDEVAIYDKPLSPGRIAAHVSWIALPPPRPATPLTDPGNLSNAPSGMVHYYDFNEARGSVEGFSLNFAYDRIGAADGAFEGRAGRTEGLLGRGAVTFDNSFGAGINVGAEGFEMTAGISVEAVIVPTWSGDAGNYDEIFRKEDGGNRILFGFQNDPFSEFANPPLAPNVQVLSFGLNAGAYGELDMPLDGSNDAGITLASLKDGNPHHVAATYDSATGEKAIWVDGRQAWKVNLGAGTPMISGGPANAFIGNTQGGGEPFAGTIDEVAVWTRALTAAEIAAHSAAVIAGDFRPYFPPPPSGPSAYEKLVVEDKPVGYWRLGDQGPAAADTSGNGRNGEADGDVFWGADPLLANDRNPSLEHAGGRILVPGFEKIGERGFSVEFLVLADAPPGGFRNLVGDGEGGLNFNLMVYMTASGQIRPHFQTTDNYWSLDSVQAVADGRPHHIVATWDQITGVPFLYIDGKVADYAVSAGGAFPTTGTAINTGNSIFIGKDDREPGFTGLLDEVALYDYPLSAERVLAHFTEALGGGTVSNTITGVSITSDGRVRIEGTGTAASSDKVDGPYTGAIPLPATIVPGTAQFYRPNP